MKTKHLIYGLIGFISCIFVLSCGNNKTEKDKINLKEYEKPLEKANKHLVKTENEQIEDYISRYNWKMQETGTGLRYLIYEKGDGENAEKGKVVKINFTVNLINGNKCYSSIEDGPKEFVLGKSDEINGLHEGILLMKKGDKAKFIIPSHLAFGLLGDNEKIPMRATLIYDIELLKN